MSGKIGQRTDLKGTHFSPAQESSSNAQRFMGDVHEYHGDAFTDRGGDIDEGDINLMNAMTAAPEVGEPQYVGVGDVKVGTSKKVGTAKVMNKLEAKGVPPRKALAATTASKAQHAASRLGAKANGAILENDSVMILNPSSGIEIVQTGTLRTDARVPAGKVKWNLYSMMDQPYKRFYTPGTSVAASTSFYMASYTNKIDATYQAMLLEVKIDSPELYKTTSSEVQVTIATGTNTGGAFTDRVEVYSFTARYMDRKGSPSIVCVLAKQVDGEWYPNLVNLRNDTTAAEIENIQVTVSGVTGDIATISVYGTECDYGRQLMSSLTRF